MVAKTNIKGDVTYDGSETRKIYNKLVGGFCGGGGAKSIGTKTMKVKDVEDAEKKKKKKKELALRKKKKELALSKKKTSLYTRRTRKTYG